MAKAATIAFFVFMFAFGVSQSDVLADSNHGKMMNLQTVGEDSLLSSLTYCAGTYTITTQSGKVSRVREFYLRFKTDSSAHGPAVGKPTVIAVGMQGDRFAAVFSSPEELKSFPQTTKCEETPVK